MKREKIGLKNNNQYPLSSYSIKNINIILIISTPHHLQSYHEFVRQDIIPYDKRVNRIEKEE